jgi:hypothetical protein
MTIVVSGVVSEMPETTADLSASPSTWKDYVTVNRGRVVSWREDIVTNLKPSGRVVRIYNKRG